MAEYIDRERLLRRFNIDDMMNVNGTLISMNDARDTISNFPAADVAPVAHGHWLTWEEKFPDKSPRKKNNLGTFCTICGNHADSQFDYCPNCGAKMDLEVTDNG